MEDHEILNRIQSDLPRARSLLTRDLRSITIGHGMAIDTKQTDVIWYLVQSIISRPFYRSLTSTFSATTAPARRPRRTLTGRRTLPTPGSSTTSRTRHTGPRQLAPLLPALEHSSIAISGSMSESLTQSQPESGVQSVADNAITANIGEAAGNTSDIILDCLIETNSGKNAPESGHQLLDIQLVSPADVGAILPCQFCAPATDQCLIHSSSTASGVWEEASSDVDLFRELCLIPSEHTPGPLDSVFGINCESVM